MGKLYLSRHVTFDENIFLFTKATTSTPTTIATPCPTPFSHSPVPPVYMVPLDDISVTPIAPDATTTLTQSPTPGMASSSSTSNPSFSQSPLPITPAPPTCTYPMVTRAQNNIFCPKQLSVTTKHPLAPPLEPTYVSQALKDPQWCKAMTSEFTALIKRHPDGTVDWFKACLVAKGFNQCSSVDYIEAFSFVIKLITIRLILSLALSNNWPLKQIDINNTFLHGQLIEQVFMQQPSDFIDQSYPHHVCSLQKSIYGLKQGLRAWYNALRSDLLELKMAGAKEVKTPMSVSTKLMLDDGSTSCDATEYRHTIGSFQYLSLTCPDLSFAVNCLAHFMHKSTIMH
ncbi:Retrovirus-related Pol polyprotein from transposon RE2 [Vitis vinifera]|uniref:Retrovirus-related Pol polyprotein from transposon RE2 n=1 Tax=Vitis vinifera TaxID=29760 RepID=A0A438HE93_VITVI|nr:Retrovirus-related Pol polyprotein from transposon RE2 [Vitis vinifera]